MATATLDAQLKTQLSKAFLDQFDPFRQENLFVGFAKIAGSGQATRTETTDTLTRKNILYAKMVSPSDIAFVIDRVDWTSGTNYDEFDPSLDMSTKNFYVLGGEDSASPNIYICTKKGGATSLEKPVGTTPEVEIKGDGYEWRFVAKVTGDLTKFLNSSYIPIKVVPYYSDLPPASYDQTDEDIFQYTSQYDARANVNNGKIQSVKVTAAGTPSVYSRTVKAGANQQVVASTSTTTQISSLASSVDDFYNGYAIKFNTGPRAGLIAKITDYVGSTRLITHAALSVNAGAGDRYEIYPLVEFTGDGSGATAHAFTDSSGQVQSIEILNGGTNYKNATATITTSQDSGTDPTLTPLIFKDRGQDPVFELFASAVKLYVALGDDNDEIMKQNEYKEIFLASGFNVGASYDNTGKLAGHDISTVTRIDVLNDGTDPVAINDYVYGQDSFAFGRVQTFTINNSDGHLNVKNMRGEFVKDEKLSVLDSGSTLSFKNENLTVVRTRKGDTTLTIPKQNWRGTHEVGISFDTVPVIDTSVTGGSGGVGLIAEIFNIQETGDPTATIRLTQVYGGTASGTVDFTVGETLTTSVGQATIKTISGPEIDLDSGRMLYIEGITAVSRQDEQEDVIEFVFDF
ncbi:hypothetical protein [Hyphomonas sp.]|uniref:hypothetical protein n=1 Tax=Hyphomonas sp. TaxID=87 RepID=UPI000C92B428|nr:hypothetical protein [Hyphomonas sp.]MAL45850.1 hypothetical protein [Hyphomonas sp.]